MRIILYSAIAGICGTGLGGLVTTLFIKKPGSAVTCYLMMFSGGVMISIVCFGLVPQAIGLTGLAVSIVGLAIGVVAILLLNRLVDKITGFKGGNLGVHQTPEEVYHESEILNAELHAELNTGQHPARMFRSGILMLFAIGLHNIPEGLAIGAGGTHDERLGIALTIMIALHNIPEGMAIAAPLISGGFGKPKATWLTTLAGAPTLLGGIAGVLFGGVSSFSLSLSLAAAGGAMLYVTFGEIIPQSIVMTKSRMPSIILLVGVIAGLVVAKI